MLDLKAAPSSNPVLAAANATNAANAPASAAGATAGDGGDAVALPEGKSFAALLKQATQGLDNSAAKAAVDALLAAQTLSPVSTDVATEAVTPTDPISLLAPMLAGIALPQTVGETSDEAEDPATELAAGIDSAPLAAPIAAPVSIATNTPAAAPTAQASPGTAPATVTDNLPQSGEKTPEPTANIAAPSAAAAEEVTADTASGKQPANNFDAVLNAAKEAQVLASPHSPVRSANGATPAAAGTPVAAPVGSPGWGSEVGDKVAWMVGRQETRAELVLNPPQLGRIEVSVSMNGDQATATFTSANAAVREALENAMPRLREVLQGAGISLGQTQVGAESFQQAADQRQTGDNSSRSGGGDSDDPHALASGHDTAAGQWLKRGNGMVDTFA